MIEVKFTLAHKRFNPFIQLAVALCTGWVGMFFCKIVHPGGGVEFFAAMVAIIFFAILNTVVSITYNSFFKYTVPSWYIYIMLVVVLFFSAKLLSGISIWKLEEYRMMLLSVTLFYFVASSLVRLVRLLYNAAENA
jgi:hypothetical protein